MPFRRVTECHERPGLDLTVQKSKSVEVSVPTPHGSESATPQTKWISP